ncbi:S8 family serine peptidase [Streptomyces luteolifulvus]|uniref:S8 family serine peptidase n=1 Tax=Streptomyces luteolifulvus TaxID=2615112 RepID=A0A6H9UZ89_9ACTN|nr:S8 family serine peptidase [Streptomyces luteolifulvus]KAB1144991.1 S8 family serine peptidase [Streptomyces luteolifulvus]
MTTNRCPVELELDTETLVILDETRLLLGFREPQEHEALEACLRELDLELEPSDSAESKRFQGEIVSHTDRLFWVCSSLGEAIEGELYDAVEAAFDEQLEWIGPVYHHPHVPGRAGLQCPLPNALLVKEGVVEAPLPTDIELREDEFRSRYLPGYRYYTIVDPRSHPAHEVRARLLEHERYDSNGVLFENMAMLYPYTFEPVDTFYKPDAATGYRGQWNLVKTHIAGPGRTAWDLHMGQGTIAVIDSGCDLSHSDLYFVGGLGGPNNIGDDNPSLPGFARGHGTMVAGVAAATTHNLKGVAGVAGYGAKVMPLAFTTLTDGWFVHLLTFAVDNGADVINMSFSMPSWGSLVAVDQALTRAYNSNIVLCASSGNSGGAVGFPASHKHVIACGATDATDSRAAFSSKGSALSVMAPGVDIPTTAVRGTGNLSDLDRRDWLSDFWGTSPAAAHVSGLAALLLSVDPSLTPDEVRAIIEGTADRVPLSWIYDQVSANGPRNADFGHGRINALDALLAALPPRLRRKP